MESVLNIDRKMRCSKFSYTSVAVVLFLIGSLLITTALSALTSTATIHNNGIIFEGYEGSEITAQSGSVSDIQAAVDTIANVGGGTVHIPLGNFTFDILHEGSGGVCELQGPQTRPCGHEE